MPTTNVFPSSFVKVIYFNVCCVPNYLTVNCINYFDNKQKKRKVENGKWGKFPIEMSNELVLGAGENGTN